MDGAQDSEILEEEKKKIRKNTMRPKLKLTMLLVMDMVASLRSSKWHGKGLGDNIHAINHHPAKNGRYNNSP